MPTGIERARSIKEEYRVKWNKKKVVPLIDFVFPTIQGGAYSKSGSFSMWDRARARLGIDKESPPEERIQFKDLHSLGATDAARARLPKEEIRRRLAHSSAQTSEIYIKKAIAEVSEIDLPLP